MKPESLAMGGEKYVNIIVTLLMEKRVTDENLIVDLVNAKFGQSYAATSLSPEEKIFLVGGHLIDETIYQKAAEIRQQGIEDFKDAAKRIDIL